MLNDDRLFERVASVDEIGPVAPPLDLPSAAAPLPAKLVPPHVDDKGAAGSDTPSLLADTVPGGTGSTATLAMNSSVDVTVDTLGDHDWYRVSLTAGQRYTIHTSSYNATGVDSYLTVRDAAGNALASDDDGGDGSFSLIDFTATTTGTYFIDAGTYADQSTGTFHLSIAPVLAAGDSVLGSTATTATLALNGSVDGNIDTSGDHDFYRIDLVAGQTYIFRTGGIVADDAVTDTILTLRNASGTSIVSNDDAGEGAFSAIRYTVTQSGTFYLDVSAFNTGTGAFNLTAFTTPTPTVYTNDQIANQLTNGYWGGGSHHFAVSPGGSLTFNVQALTAPGQVLARAALALWTDATGITFTEVTTGGQIVYDDNQTGAFASASYSGGITTSANVNVSTQWLTDYGTGLNSYSFQTYIHETGHALGLGHAGNYNGSASYASDSLYINDAWATTIMSYFDQTENTYFQAQGFTRQFALTPMVADGIAVANLYGTATSTRTGNTTYGFNNTSGQAIYDATQYPSISYTIFDNGGIDTLDYSGFGQNQLINLNAETFSNIGSRVGNVSIARGAVIENAVGGSGNDTIIGNAAANTLNGNGGVNNLQGGAGNDRLIVGAGANGTIVDGGADSDTLVVTGSVSLGGLTGIEAVELQSNATLTLTGSQFDTGLPSGTVLSGTGTITVNMAADQFLFGSTLSVLGGSSIATVFNGSSGNDYVKAVSQATNTMLGGDGDDFLRGGQLADIIDGGTGGDKITGFGGADTLTGGAGADQFRYLTQNDSGLGANADHITDFVSGTDRLNFQLFDLDPNAPDLQNPGFSFLGNGGFHATGGAEIRYEASGADMMVQVDVNGDGLTDMAIYLNGLGGGTLTSADFML